MHKRDRSMRGTEVEIRSARLHLRGPRASDTDRLFALFANWEVIRWLSAPPWPYRREDMQEFLDRQAGLEHLIISLDEMPIGAIGVHMQPPSQHQRHPG